ncbi:uncharacterized protein [Asterias amurensis]|uniref:uncharacterized protein isoform X2 n=1 Tax=Asterias amurensis TaxID=7602 RepID=UPI003AB4A869
MATNAQTSLAKIEDSIECSICTHRFRQPKWLNCFHTFCLQCLQEICKNQRPPSNKLPCPLCGQDTILNGNVSDLLDNSDMKTLVNNFTQQENVLKQQFEQLQIFSALVDKARSSKTEFELSVENIDKSLKKLDKVFLDTKEKISRKATKEVSRIRNEEQKLIKEAETIHKSKVEFLKSLQASDRREASQTARKLDEVNHLMEGGSNNGNKGQDFKKRICKDLEKAIKKHPQSVPDGLTFMDLKENDVMISLGELVQNDADLTLLQTRHPNPGSVPSSGILTGASPSPSSSPGVVNTLGLATGTAHDMSNKGAPSRPGLAPSPPQQGNVVQQQQQQPPQGMIIQSPYLIQQQRGAQMYVPMSNQQNPRGAYQQRDQAVYQQQSHLSQPSQPQYQPRQLYQQRPQFTQQNPQGQIYTQPSTPPYYSNSQPVNLQPGGATFFQSNQQGMVVQPQMRPQAYTATLPQAPQYNAAPKKKSLIRIVDPKSNQDITDTIIRKASMTTTGSSSPHSGQASASGTLPASQTPPQNHQANEKRAAIQATFAAQVARLAHDAPTPHASEAQIAVTNQMSVNPPQQRNWIPRRDTDNPKTLEQIHQDYKRDEERKKMEGLQAQMAPPPPRMSRNKRDQPQRVGPPPPEGWSTVTSTKATRVAVDPNKFKVMKQQSIDNDIQLGPSGPRSFGGWSPGSSGGSSKTQTEPPEPKQNNRFMMLSDERKGRVPESKGRGPQSLQGKRSSSSRERDEMSKERRSAMAEVQKMSQARRSQSREKDLDSRGSRGKQEAAPVSAPVREISRAAAAPAISEDVFEKKALATIKEFLSIKDVESADVVGEMWQSSGFTWDMFLPSGKDVQ